MFIRVSNSGGSRVVHRIVQDRGTMDQGLEIRKDSQTSFSVTHRVDIEKDTRFVIFYKEDEFGHLYPNIGLETNYLVHSDGRAAVKGVIRDDCVVVLPPPRQEERSTTAAATGRQQRSASYPDYSLIKNVSVTKIRKFKSMFY